MKNLHEHTHESGSHTKGALLVAIAATGFIFLVEIAGGFWTNSLALLSDAAHVFMDFFSFILTLVALTLAQRPVTSTRTFGLHRLEVFAALLNGVTVFAMAALILIHAIQRFKDPQVILAPQMLVIAVLGLVVNLIVVWFLRPHAHNDLNVRSALLHAFGDAAASVAVIIGGALVMTTGKSWMDPAAAVIVSLIILAGAYKIFSDAVHILLEGAPREIRREAIVQSIEQIAGADSVKDLHIWNLCSHICALSVHLKVREDQMPQQREILEKVNASLKEKYNIVHPTIQIESQTWN